MKTCKSIVLAFLLGLAVAIARGESSRADEKAAVPADHARRMQEGLALFKEHVRPASSSTASNATAARRPRGASTSPTANR